MALAETLGYVVSPSLMAPSVGGPRGPRDLYILTIQAVHLRSARICLDVGVPVDLHGVFSIEAIALEGALLVVVTTPTTCTLLRLEGAESS